MPERFTNNEEVPQEETGFTPDVFFTPEQIGEGETGGSREELLKAFGESDEEIGVESIDELKGLLRGIGLPDEEIERRLAGMVE